MKNNNNTLIVLLILSLLFTQQISADEIKKVYKVGFAQDTMSNDWRVAQVNEMKAALEPYPFIQFIHSDAKGKALRQIHDLQMLDKQGVDILVTSPRDRAAMTPVIERLNRKKPVVLLSRKPLKNEFTSFVGANDRAIAREAAKLIAKKLNGKGRVVMINGVMTATTAIERENGFVNELNNYPGIEIVAAPVADYRRDKAIIEMDKLLKQKLEFDAIFAHSDSMASGARMAMERAGLDAGDYVIVGIDYIPEAKEAIIKGKQTASFTYPTAGAQGAEIVLKLIRGENVDKYVDVPFTLVTIENVHKVPTIFK